MYQQLLSLYIHILFKSTYRMDTSREVKEDYKLFRNSIKNFKQEVIHKKYEIEDRKYDFNSVNNTNDQDLEILLEWDGRCFEDINLLKEVIEKDNDLHVFIQAKWKWEALSNIGLWDGILKTLFNFQKNINFQKYKYDDEILFFIFINKSITNKVQPILNKTLEWYLIVIDYIVTENLNLAIPNPELPQKRINKFKSDYYLKIIEEVLNDTLSISEYENETDIESLADLIFDLQIIFDKMKIICNIKPQVLIEEMNAFFDWNLWNEMFQISLKSSDVTPINRWDPDFLIYERFKYTFFSSQDEWKYVSQLNQIGKWKFI